MALAACRSHCFPRAKILEGPETAYFRGPAYLRGKLAGSFRFSITIVLRISKRKRKSTVPLVGSAARMVEELRAEAHKARWTCNANKQHERERAERACTKTVSIERHMRRVMHAQR